MINPGKFWSRLGAVAVVGVLGLATATAASATTTPKTPAALSGGTVHYAIAEPVCAQPKDPNAIRCFAMKRVDVAKGTKGARAYVRPDYIGLGPAGGYTPDDIAAAYHFNPNTNASSQLVGIVDWYDDPYALSDLDTFDQEYGLRAETATSFRKVNQNGRTAPLPKPDHESSGEIALDVESVRGVCHTCRILLIEANSGTDANLATAENLAVRIGATEITNSFGETERAVPASVRAAYNHPGVVITASTGDDGWYAWDRANDDSGYSANAPEYPSSDPNVVAVGGTSLYLNNDGTRAEEDVWNENGADDENGLGVGHQGAGGGGCSTLYAAKPWQAHYAGYAAAGCGGKRLAADISAIADSSTGFDVLDNYATTPGWATIGGTSLASPVVAAMYALAGGSHGAAYPSSTLYANGTHRASSLFDVTAGGNGFCAGDSTANCGNDAAAYSGTTNNPNALGGGNVDCSFPRSTASVTSAPPFSSECNAVTGYDGPSGLGTPVGLGLFATTNPSVTLTRPALLKLRTSAAFTATAREPLSGVRVTSYSWNWGDGHSTSATSGTSRHTYTRAGAYTVTLTVTDSTYQTVIKTTKVTVGEKASVHLTGPKKLAAHKKGSFSSRGTSDPNTGAKVTKVTWKWGDGHSTRAGKSLKVTHAYKKAGTYKITVVIVDNTGVTTTAHKKVKVKS